MARRSRMSVLKRQREAKKADKAAAKRAKRQGTPQPVFTEPKPTVDIGALTEGKHEKDETEETDSQ